ncbi:hypothetical protein ACIO13_32355 [Streptomyces sp. NPDC087425]|uniref:hypothetical protein n=1 Tax=Streptomyces sp. NPDC087425 TaxID=3365787 RepID=UPI00380EF088
MPDRSLRLFTLPPLPGGERSGVLLRDRRSSAADATSGKPSGDEQSGATQDDNPFAPPPEGAPDRPWQPRRPASEDDSHTHSGSGSGSGSDTPGDDGARSPWGSQWSDRQPGRSSGNFGDRPGPPPQGPEGPDGPSGPGGSRPTPPSRWDPADPIQRRARYSLLSGMWAFFFALFSWPSVALLLAALSLYWGVSALRAKSQTKAKPGTDTSRPQTTAAVSGLVVSSLALILVAGAFAAQLVYKDYYTCTTDALTNQAKQSCTHFLPKELRSFLATQD